MSIRELASLIYNTDREAFAPYKVPRGTRWDEYPKSGVMAGVMEVASRCQAVANPVVQNFYSKNKLFVRDAIIDNYLIGSD